MKTKIERDFQHAKESAAEAAKFELLLTDEPGFRENLDFDFNFFCSTTFVYLQKFSFVETSGMERSYRIPQKIFAEELPQQAANKVYCEKLEKNNNNRVTTIDKQNETNIVDFQLGFRRVWSVCARSYARWQIYGVCWRTRTHCNDGSIRVEAEMRIQRQRNSSRHSVMRLVQFSIC